MRGYFIKTVYTLDYARASYTKLHILKASAGVHGITYWMKTIVRVYGHCTGKLNTCMKKGGIFARTLAISIILEFLETFEITAIFSITLHSIITECFVWRKSWVSYSPGFSDWEMCAKKNSLIIPWRRKDCYSNRLLWYRFSIIYNNQFRNPDFEKRKSN